MPLQQPTISSIQPEWLRIEDAVRRFGIGRSTLYCLIRDCEIKAALIRRRGNVTGRRLIFADSLRAYVEKFANEDRP